MDADLPYKIEYAKSGRASCKVCKNSIPKDGLRIATVVQNPYHDSKMERWHHVECFFETQKPKTITDLANYDNIRWEDQKIIEEKITARNTLSVSTSIGSSDSNAKKGKSKGRKRGKSAPAKPNCDIMVEYSKSSRATCRGCNEKIIIREVRVLNKDYECDEARRFGGVDRWYHLECFAKLRSKLGFVDDGMHIPGAGGLSGEDKEMLAKLLPKMSDEQSPSSSKKLKVDDEEEKRFQEQNKAFFEMRDQLSSCSKAFLVELLRYNYQHVPHSLSEILDALADAMLFGAMRSCPKCSGNLKYVAGIGYKCTERVNEFLLCDFVTQEPERIIFNIPTYERVSTPFISSYKSVVKRRLFKAVAPSESKINTVPYNKWEGIVDPDSKLQDVARVYRNPEERLMYSATLGKLEENIFFKMQILEEKRTKNSWLFQKWGKIGSKEIHCKCEEMSVCECMMTFRIFYVEKTGNVFGNIRYFLKQPNKMYHIDIDNVQMDDTIDDYDSKKESKLLNMTDLLSNTTENVTDDLKKIEVKSRPLSNLDFVISVKSKEERDELEKGISLLGGNVKTSFSKDAFIVISITGEVSEKSVEAIKDAQKLGIHVVSKDFVEEVKNFTGSVDELLKKKSITSWNNNDQVKLEPTAMSTSEDDNILEMLMEIITPSTCSIKTEDETDSTKIQVRPHPLKTMSFVISSIIEKGNKDLKREIMLLGGNVKTKISKDTFALISTEEEVSKMTMIIKKAQKFDVYVVSVDFIKEAKELTNVPIELVKKRSIASWGSDPKTKVSEPLITNLSSKGNKGYEITGIAKQRVKGGEVVDLDSKLQDVAHVYHCWNNVYTVTLGNTDIQTNKNSFYKMQILKHDDEEKYWFFRKWGRIGTKVGNHKCESMPVMECINKFKYIYKEKTGNNWEYLEMFKKYPNKMYHIEIDHGDVDDILNYLDSNGESNLKKPVHDLMKFIFDIKALKDSLLEYNIDMDKMPLGKITTNEIYNAYIDLKEISKHIKCGNPNRDLLIELSNSFYTIIPHNFGLKKPTIIETEEEVEAKRKMLDSMYEMEIAYDILHTKIDPNVKPFDAYYQLLKTNIDVLDKESDEFKLIEKYVKNTHSSMHFHFELDIEEVFVIEKEGEKERFKPYENLHNKRLLWHGSLSTNFAGILSKGLRIAPPEAPCNGYAFGKGVYFADMVSKSAGYCGTNYRNPTGLLLLCEVALGDMYIPKTWEFIDKLPDGKHSTWARGSRQPDPGESVILENGVEVPCGTHVESESNSLLCHNEFIVYNVSQVKMKYLVKMKYKYN